MSSLEVIGFFIALIVLLFVQTKRKFGRHVDEKRIPLYQEKQVDPLVHLLTALEKKQSGEKSKHAAPPMPKIKPKQQRPRRAVPEIVHKAPEYSHKHEEGHIVRRPSRVRQILRGLPHLQNVVVLQEIIGKPKALRNDDCT